MSDDQTLIGLTAQIQALSKMVETGLHQQQQLQQQQQQQQAQQQQMQQQLLMVQQAGPAATGPPHDPTLASSSSSSVAQNVNPVAQQPQPQQPQQAQQPPTQQSKQKDYDDDMDDSDCVSDSSEEGSSHQKSSFVRKDFVPKFTGFGQRPKDCGSDLYDRFQFGFGGLPASEWKALEPLWEHGFGANSVQPLSFPPESRFLGGIRPFTPWTQN